MVPQAPDSSRLLRFSSYGVNDLGGPHTPRLLTATTTTKLMQFRSAQSRTQHDISCSGISSLSDSRIVIIGGSDAAVTSIYNPATNAFTRGPDMKIARAYQTSTTLSNGKILTIGGSYFGGIGGKAGKLLDPSTNAWTVIPGANVKPMLTTYDAEGEWRTDNHEWLFGWKNGAVFQAGPSREMHYYSTTGNGGVTSAGVRVFTDTEGILFPELYNPNTKTFTKLAPAAVPRNYHTISHLFPDATIFTGGRGLCFNPNGDG